MYCSSVKMYICYRSCLIMLLEISTHAFGEVVIKTLETQHLNDTYFGALESS